MSVNQAHIARQLGISQRTVSAALAGTGRVSEKRRSQVLQAAQRLGYRLNSAARAQRMQRFDAVGLLLSTEEGRSYLPQGLFNGIHDALHDAGKHLAIAKLPDAELVQQGIFPRILQQWCCDGLLVNYTDRLPEGMTARLRAEAVPSIWMNRKQPTDAVYYDDFGGAEQATEHLLSLGHRRILYLDFVGAQPMDGVHYSRVDRRAGYEAAMRQAGRQALFSDSLIGTPSRDRLDALVALLSRPDRPTAILTYDAAHRVLYAAALVGLRVPADLSLMTFGDEAFGTSAQHGEMYLGRSIAQMGLPTAEVGRQAVALLQQKIDEPQRVLNSRVLPLVLQAGDSCGGIGI